MIQLLLAPTSGASPRPTVRRKRSLGAGRSGSVRARPGSPSIGTFDCCRLQPRVNRSYQGLWAGTHLRLSRNDAPRPRRFRLGRRAEANALGAALRPPRPSDVDFPQRPRPVSIGLELCHCSQFDQRVAHGVSNAAVRVIEPRGERRGRGSVADAPERERGSDTDRLGDVGEQALERGDRLAGAEPSQGTRGTLRTSESRWPAASIKVLIEAGVSK